MAFEIGHRRSGVGNRQALPDGQVIGLVDERQRVGQDPEHVDEIAMRGRAELALVGSRSGDDDQLLDSTLEEPARVDGTPEAGERTQDFRSQAHRLDHLDRRLAAFPESAALVERWIVLDRLEGGLDLAGCNRDAHRCLLVDER